MFTKFLDAPEEVAQIFAKLSWVGGGSMLFRQNCQGVPYYPPFPFLILIASIQQKKLFLTILKIGTRQSSYCVLHPLFSKNMLYALYASQLTLMSTPSCLAVWLGSTKPMFRVEFDNRVQEEAQEEEEDVQEEQEEDEAQEPTAGPSKRRKA